MALPEHGDSGPDQPDNQPLAEGEPIPYLRAARFTGERPAGQAYFQVQEAMYTAEPNDLSAYRLRLREVWHVAVLGEPPPADLGQRIDAILAAGEPVTLPDDVVTALAERRAQTIRQGPWT